MQGIGALRFQYLGNNSERPSCGYEITDVMLELGVGMPIPRIGEFVSHHPFDKERLPSGNPLVVLAVHYQIERNPDDHAILHRYRVTVTLGDIPQDTDNRLFDIRG